MAILFRKHERLSNLAQNSVKRYIPKIRNYHPIHD